MADPILVVPYEASWAKLFEELGAELRAALGETALRIDHIGSTAVPGLDAKPILDLQISVVGLEPVDAYRAAIERVGFVLQPDNPERTKRYFREAPGRRRTHLHVRRWGSWGEQFALLFRDYLRCHAADARRYAALKYELAKQYRSHREGYVAAKAPIIWELMQLADRWSQVTGWEPGPSDA